MFVYGFHPVREVLRRRPADVVRVLVSARQGRRANEVRQACGAHGVRVEESSPAALTALVGGVHNGFVAELAASAETVAGGDEELVVLLEDVQDPRNLGAVLRVCEGAGVGRVLLRDRGSTAITPTVSKASAGASEWLPVDRIPNPAQAIRRYRDEGYWIYGAAGEGEPVWDVDLRGKLVLCFGGEEKGLRRLARESCDGLVGLPMRGRIESLNLATAVSAILYEALRQRR